MSFGQRLKELRLNKKLSQSKLAGLAGLHYTQIGRYERGDSTPSAEVLKKLADILEVSTDYLMEGTTGEVAQSHLHDRELLRQFQQIEKLTDEDKKVVKTFLDAFITKKHLNELVAS